MTLIGMALLLGGCSGQSREWWIGEWQVDREFTRQQMEPETAETEEGTGRQALEALRGMAEGLLLGMLENARVEISPTHVILSAAGLSKAERYEVLDHPRRNEVRVRLEDGSVRTWILTDDRLAMTFSGTGEKPVYFQRIETN